VESESGIVTGLSPDEDYSGNGITTPCTATLHYDTGLNARVSGKTREEAFKVYVYAIYESGGQDYSVKLTAEIQDCAFAGAYTASDVWLEFMPYNLGANPDYATLESQMAYTPDPNTAASTDSTVYGGLYQWGRPTDGHQIRKHKTDQTSTPSTTTVPKHGQFIITTNTTNYNWYDHATAGVTTAIRDSLWTKASKADNDPCPTGYKVPTIAQWRSIFNGRTGTSNSYTDVDGHGNDWTWESSTATKGAYSGSTLFLPAAGSRDSSDGSLSNAGSYGDYWSSSVIGTYAYTLRFSSSYVTLGNSYYSRAHGFSVRCVAY
jgi:uncharacterized protein (TIGR02145 family)